MSNEVQNTKTWILKHPVNVMQPPNGYRQVETVESQSTFDGARRRAAQLNLIQREGYGRNRAAHYASKDLFTVIELNERSTAMDAVEAFFSNSDVRREVIT